MGAKTSFSLLNTVSGEWSVVSTSRFLKLISDLAPTEIYCQLPIALYFYPVNSITKAPFL
jgi:hypothetical protein